MLQTLEHLARFLFVTLGLDLSGQSLALLMVASAVGLATAALIVAANQCGVAVAAFFGRPNPQRRTARVVTPVLLGQSAPDAPGKPRPRAPGEVLAVAAH